MQTKLTLRLERALIERAKAYSKRTGKSVSRLVADYFAILDPAPGPATDGLPPMTSSLMGALSNKGLDEEEYRDHLANKYR